MAVITGQCSPSFSFNQVPTTGFLAGTTLPIAKSIALTFKNSGVLADQVDTVAPMTLTFVAATPQTIDLTALTDVLGNAVSFARVRFLAIRINTTTDGQALIVGNSGTNEWSGAAAMLSAGGTLRVLASTAAGGNSGFVIVAAPNTTGHVVDATHKTLKLDPGSGAFSVDIVIAGCSA